jgi:tetratricopeptide (TPR) repeat protein
MKKVWILVAAALLAAFVLTGCQQTAVTAAKVYLQQKNYDAAIVQAKKAVEQVPNDAEAYFVLGQAYGFKGMYIEMNDAYTKSLENSQSHAADIERERANHWVNTFNAGVSSYRQDKLDEAIELFKIAIILQPKKTEGHKNLAFAYAQKGDFDTAIKTYEEGIEMDPNDLELKNYLGQLYYNMKKFDEAIEILSDVVQNSQPATDVYNQALLSLAFSYDMTNQAEKAIQTYTNAIENDPENTDLLFNMGRLQQQLEKYEEAITYFKQVIENNPNDFDSMISVGNCYLQLEKFTDSIPYFEKATELKPDSVQAWNNLGVAYFRSGQEEKGKEAFTKADQLKGEQ